MFVHVQQQFFVELRIHNKHQIVKCCIFFENGALLAFNIQFTPLNNDRSVAGGYDSPLVLF